MRWILLGLFLLLIAPIQVGAALRWSGNMPSLMVGVMIWGIRAQTEIHAQRDEAGTLLLTAAMGKRSLTLHPVKRGAGNGLKALALLVKSNTKRAALKKLVRVRTLDVFLQIGGENAAFIALATGFLQTLSPLAPKAKIVCRPSFHGDTKAYLRCIAEARLGILLAAWLRWRRTQQASQKEEQAWTIPSGT